MREAEIIEGKIKASELRIGNWVNRRFWNPVPGNAHYALERCRVEIIHPTRINVRLKDNSILKLPLDLSAPIPLTPEILEKAGFTEDRIGRYCLERLTISKDSCWWYSIDCTDYDGDTGTVLTEITHLHQLQNLYFCLTGQELEIKL